MVKKNQIWNNYNNLIISEDIGRIRKLLIRYDLFKKTSNIPGDIVECGVFKGVGLFLWLKFLKIYLPNSNKKVIGFDMFSHFPKNIESYEKLTAKKYVKDSMFKGTNVKSLEKIAFSFCEKEKLELIKGDITKTAKNYAKKNKGFKISLLHLDLDTYKGTLRSLQAFYPHVSKGGLIVLDEYGSRGWGETDAVDEFLKDKKLKITTIENSQSPTACIKIT